MLISEDQKDFGEITEWVRNLYAEDDKDHLRKLAEYLIKPAKMWREFEKSGQKEKANELINNWLAFDIYLEYNSRLNETIVFILGTGRERRISDGAKLRLTNVIIG